MQTIVLATNNPHKVEELRPIFAGHGLAGVRFICLSDLTTKTTEPHEHGTTFEENAAIKAVEYARQTGFPCLADDSGLEVDALQGRPGVISSHYCTDGRETGMTREERDRRNNERVLRELEGVEPGKRSARFVCVMALAMPGASIPVLTSRGTFEGSIGIPPTVPKGANGFGYDPLFLVAPDYTMTGAELSPSDKNSRSHRAHAARLIAAKIAQLPNFAPQSKVP